MGTPALSFPLSLQVVWGLHILSQWLLQLCRPISVAAIASPIQYSCCFLFPLLLSLVVKTSDIGTNNDGEEFLYHWLMLSRPPRLHLAAFSLLILY